MRTPHLLIAALTGASAVALGAFGAHALKDTLAAQGTTATWQTASLYHLVHAPVLLLLALRTPTPRRTMYLFLAGILLFSGSLYLLCLTKIKPLGAVTPIGGTLLILAWLDLLRTKGSEQ
jgi:uncharacterized membrane protein YgdD (TMEM256/DUF423 family)